jgi:hypothetical protein
VINYLPEEQPDADEVIKLIEAEGRKVFAIHQRFTSGQPAGTAVAGFTVIGNRDHFAG